MILVALYECGKMMKMIRTTLKGAHTHVVFGKNQTIVEVCIAIRELNNTDIRHVPRALILVVYQILVHFNLPKIPTFLGMTNTKPNMLSLERVLHYTLLVISRMFAKYRMSLSAFILLEINKRSVLHTQESNKKTNDIGCGRGNHAFQM